MRAEPTPSHVGQLVKHDGTLSNCIRCSYRCGLSLSSGEWTAYWWRWWWRPALQSCSEFVILLLWKECPDSIPGIHLFICKTYLFGKFLVKHPHWFQESGAACSFLDLSQRAFLLGFWAQEGGLLPTRHSAQCKHGPDGQTLRIFSIFRSNRCVSALFPLSLKLSFQMVHCPFDSFEARSSSLRQWDWAWRATTYDCIYGTRTIMMDYTRDGKYKHTTHIATLPYSIAIWEESLQYHAALQVSEFWKSRACSLSVKWSAGPFWPCCCRSAVRFGCLPCVQIEGVTTWGQFYVIAWFVETMWKMPVCCMRFICSLWKLKLNKLPTWSLGWESAWSAFGQPGSPFSGAAQTWVKLHRAIAPFDTSDHSRNSPGCVSSWRQLEVTSCRSCTKHVSPWCNETTWKNLCFFVANLIERNQNLWGTRWAQEKTAHLLCSHRHFRSHQPLFPVKYEFDVSRAKKGLCSMTGVTLATLGTCQFDILRSDLKEDEVSWTHSYKCLACNKLIRINSYLNPVLVHQRRSTIDHWALAANEPSFSDLLRLEGLTVVFDKTVQALMVEKGMSWSTQSILCFSCFQLHFWHYFVSVCGFDTTCKVLLLKNILHSQWVNHRDSCNLICAVSIFVIFCPSTVVFRNDHCRPAAGVAWGKFSDDIQRTGWSNTWSVRKYSKQQTTGE